MLVVRRCGVDFVGDGAKAIGFADKASLLMLAAFTLRSAVAVGAAIAPASAAAPAAAAAAGFAILARLLAARLTGSLAMGRGLILAVRKLSVGLVFALRRAFRSAAVGGLHRLLLMLAFWSFATVAVSPTSATAAAAAASIAAFTSLARAFATICHFRIPGRVPKAPGQRPTRPRRALHARRVRRWPPVV